jgi:hypothetical protein
MFKAKIEIDKFDDYMKLVSQGSEKTIIKEPVEKLVEITKEENPICPFCGGESLVLTGFDTHSVFLNGNKEIPTQSISIMCDDCNMIHQQHRSKASRYQK